MEVEYVGKRAHLFHLLQQHPEWTLQQYADAVGCSQSMVCTWRQRFRETKAQGALDASIFFSRSRAPHHHPSRIDTEVKERVLSIRQAPPEPLQRTPGPLAILYYLQRDEALQAKKARLPRSTRTIWRILDAAGAIERDHPRQRSPRLPRAPLEEVQLDFKDVSTVPADLHDPDARAAACDRSLQRGSTQAPPSCSTPRFMKIFTPKRRSWRLSPSCVAMAVPAS